MESLEKLLRPKAILLLMAFTLQIVASSYLTSSRGNRTISLLTKDSMKVVDDTNTNEGGEEEEETSMIIDRPKGEEPIGPLGHDFGENIGVGPAEGVRCIEKRPRGEDDLDYCSYVSPDNQKKRRRDALNLLVLTSFGKGSDAHKRLLRSASVYKYEIQTLGGEETVDTTNQVRFLRETLDKINKEKPRIILFIDGPLAILASGPLRVSEEFDTSQAGILVSSSGILLGEKALKQEFPTLERGRRYMDAGAFVGDSEKIESLLKEFPDETNLQEIFTKAFTKASFQKKFNIKIDHVCNVFQNLNGSTADLEMRFIGKEAYIQNIEYRTVPVVIRGDDQTRTTLNTYGSYLAKAWYPEEGCRECWEDMKSLENIPDEELPVITLAVFVEEPTPFLEEFLLSLDELVYPRSRINLFIHNAVDFHRIVIDKWVERTKKEFKHVMYKKPDDSSMKEWHAKSAALDYCLERECEYIFYVNSDARIDNPYGLKLLLEQNRQVIAPMLPRPGKAWSNFWGSLTADGFYARSEDYMDIIKGDRRGVWNVPYVGSCYLLRRSLIEDPSTKPSFIYNLLDPDMAFNQNLRDKGIFIYVSNRVDFGHLVNSENFNTANFNPELWQMFDNRWDWEKRYLHENYSQSLNESNKIQQPCPDVYWFPIFTERYAKEMIALMENYGQWSDGSHMDKRLEGGYETVPTVDIHMNQVYYNDEWLEILRAYVQPLQLRVFDGYYNDVGPPRALMSFTVRYKPDEQPFLRPHHDTSTYTINVGLNRPGIDFEGGGCRFVRYNCSVKNTRVGWMLMHPGRLTHLHEGLYVTKGTRYIIVTFVDP